MRTGLIAEKLGMSSGFNEKGERVPLTLLRVEDCQVVAHRTIEKDGYRALVVGAKNAKASRVSKPMREVFAKANIEAKVALREFRVSEDSYLEVGTNLTPELFTPGALVDVTGTSIGKGFAGAMKRWNFAGLEASHGVSVSHRSHGSTGGCQDPGRVFKNKKMAGHLGAERVTIQNLQIFAINAETGVIFVKGAIPGSKGSRVYVTDAIKKTIAVR